MIEKLRALWQKDPGFVVSCGAHIAVLALLIVNFSRPPDLSPIVESVPIEVLSATDLNEISQGEKTAKQMPTPQRRVDKVAELEDHKPAPPTPDAKKDTPTPPSPEKANDDPGDDDKPTEKAAAVPPPAAKAAPPVPTPPERPVEKTETKPDDMKPPPDDAEALDKKPPPRPKLEPKKIAKETPPAPPKRPDTPKPEAKPKTLDQVAKLLDTMKPPKPVKKQRAGNEAKDAKHTDFSLDKITALLDHEAPQRKASTGRQLTQLASLGLPTGHAEKLSPSMKAAIDSWLIDHYRGCWSYFGLGATQDYVPQIHVRMAPDGSLIGHPALVNPPSDPNLRSLADSALRAVNRCDPLPMPDWIKAHYEVWRERTVRFDPKEMS